MSSAPTDTQTFDLVGLGFGPANIAIAAALTESWNTNDSQHNRIRRVIFIEKHTTFRWHPGMLLPDARMQISFMKDLATLRNPQSPYTFLSYLHSQGRLVSFINRGSMTPTRKEYSDYLAWAAERVQEKGVQVLYGREVIAIEESPDDTISVQYRNLSTGEESIIRAKNLVLSPGGSARVPPIIKPIVRHPNVIHSSRYATSIADILRPLADAKRPIRAAVIGSGQSSAEVTLDLRSRFAAINPTSEGHKIDMIIRKGSLKPSDDSPFANEIFDPSATNTFFSLSSKHLRDLKLNEYKLTNYGVVNPRTLEHLYEVIYDQRLDSGISQRNGVSSHRGPQIDIHPYTSINTIVSNKPEQDLLLGIDLPMVVDPSSPSLVLTARNTMDGSKLESEYDLIVYATGYERTSWIDLLKNSGIGKHFGLTTLSTHNAIRLTPASKGPTPRAEQQRDLQISQEDVSSGPSSTESTPPTSPEIGMSKDGLDCPKQQDLPLSRNYRLLPIGFSAENNKPAFAPRVYLQGVEEATHGLSDTLLSVVGIRAGEVVNDLQLA